MNFSELLESSRLRAGIFWLSFPSWVSQKKKKIISTTPHQEN